MNAIKMTIIILMLCAGVSADKPSGADDIVGTWLTGSKEAKISIFKSGKYYYGKISWMKDPLDENNRPKTDLQNHDESLKIKPVMNLLMLKSFEYNATDELWENGTIYDPKNGKTYSCKLELTNASTLEVRGYIGISLVGRTDIWTRTE
jgi:uncharacterized protein (DUF2147 family)